MVDWVQNTNQLTNLKSAMKYNSDLRHYTHACIWKWPSSTLSTLDHYCTVWRSLFASTISTPLRADCSHSAAQSQASVPATVPGCWPKPPPQKKNQKQNKIVNKWQNQQCCNLWNGLFCCGAPHSHTHTHTHTHTSHYDPPPSHPPPMSCICRNFPWDISAKLMLPWVHSMEPHTSRQKYFKTILTAWPAPS